jgi:hypothetical protein
MKTLIAAMAIMLTGCPADEPKPDPNSVRYLHDGRTKVMYVKDESNPRVCFGVLVGNLDDIWAGMVPCSMLNQQPTMLVKSITRP